MAEEEKSNEPEKKFKFKKKFPDQKRRKVKEEGKIGEKPVAADYRPESSHVAKSPQGINISVIVPLLNEEESIGELAHLVEAELRKLAGNRYEIIFVDDGSTDNSFTVLRKLSRENPRIHAIRFRRNYGKSEAIAAGFAASKGNIVITMDADLQDDPAEIPNLVAKINEGYDLVSGWKKKRRDPISKTIPSRFFNYVTSIMTGVKLHDFNCGLKAYKKDVVKTIDVYGEMHRYIPAIASWEGFKVTEIPVVHHPRKFGKTKYGFTRFIKGFLDLLTLLFTTRYLKRPLHFFGTFGTLFALTGFIIDAVLTIEWALNKTALSNRPLALLGIALIIVGVQFISLGLLGELVAKNNLKNRSFNIKDRI